MKHSHWLFYSQDSVGSVTVETTLWQSFILLAAKKIKTKQEF